MWPRESLEVRGTFDLCADFGLHGCMGLNGSCRLTIKIGEIFHDKFQGSRLHDENAKSAGLLVQSEP